MFGLVGYLRKTRQVQNRCRTPGRNKSVSQARKKTRTIKLPDYGYADLNRLAEAENAFGAMTDEERERALRWFKSKYAAQWPTDQN